MKNDSIDPSFQCLFKMVGVVSACVAMLAPGISLAADPTPAPAAGKPSSETEIWFKQVDGAQQEAFQKQVAKPFEAAAADLRTHYLTSLDALTTRASTAGQLDEALAYRTERQAFEKTQRVPDDDPTTPAGLKSLHAAFRQQFAKLEQDRAAKASVLLAPYDDALAKNQGLLTQ